MARIPDIDNLGQRPNAQPRAQVVNVRNAGAVAGAVADLGEKAASIGDQMLAQEDKLSYTAAKTAVLRADVNIRQQLQDDPDYETYEQRYAEQMGKAREKAASLIRSKMDRRLFDVDTAVDFDRGRAEVAGQARVKRTNAAMATGLSSLDELKAVGRSATDDATREATIKTAYQTIDALVGSGLDPVKAANLKSEWGSGYAAGQVSAAIDAGDVDNAKLTFERLKGFLSDEAFINLNRQVDGLADDDQAIGAVDAELGVSSVERPANVPALVTTLFPGAHVTSTKRDPQSALGRANPNSFHNAGTAIDVRPIPGVTFEEYVARLKASGVNVVEAIDEVKHPSKHATGPHWHVAWKNEAPHKPPATLEAAIDGAVARLGRNATPGQRSKIVSEMTTRWRIAESAKKDREENLLDGIQEALLSNGGNWDALPRSLRSSVPAKYVPGLMSFGNQLRSREKIETDPNEYVRLSDLAATNPKGFAAINPIEYRGKMEDTDWERFVGMRSEIMGAAPADGGKNFPSIGEIRAVTGPMLEAVSVVPVGKSAEQKKQFNARVYNFEKAMLSDIQAWQVNNPGRKPTPLDLQAMADRRLLMVVPEGQEKPVPMFEARGKVTANVPTRDFQRIRNLMAPVLGREPTPNEIAQAYFREGRGGQ